MPISNKSGDPGMDELAQRRLKVELELRRRELFREIQKRNETRVIEYPPEYYDFKKFAYRVTDGFWDEEKPHLKAIGDKLMAVERGEIRRLMIFCPPRHAKSLSVSHLFPAWYLGRNPDRRIILASYEADFAASWGRKARDLLAVTGPAFFNVQVAKSPSAANNWGIAFHRGGMNTAGVGGPITGKGGNVCFPAGTNISTATGYMAIEELHLLEEKPLVWSFDHVNSRKELKKIVATQKLKTQQLCLISTKNGITIRSTPTHPFYVYWKGYIEAKNLKKGDEVIVDNPIGDNYFFDEISDVLPLDAPDTTVYDLQIDGNNNFFAERVLVHNCIIDDPIKNSEEARSTTLKEHMVDWYKTTLYTRQEADPPGALIIILTRWQEDDLAGVLIENQRTGGDKWDILSMPALAEEDDALGRDVGDALCPTWFSQEQLEQTRENLGTYWFSAMYQQQPQPEEGGQFKLEWMQQRWDSTKPQDLPIFLKKVQAVDSAFKKGVANDYSVVATWGWTGRAYYLIDVWRDKVEFHELKSIITDQYYKYMPEAVLIEDSAAGTVAIQEFERDSSIPVIPWPVRASKEARADVVSPLFQAGKVWIPTSSETFKWVHDWVDEHRKFPNGKHDDQCLLPGTVLPVLKYDDINLFDFNRHIQKVNPKMLAEKVTVINEGDKILTHNGLWKTITKKIERDYEGEVITIKAEGSLPLTITPEHPVLAVVNNGLREVYKPRATGEPQWVKAQDLKVGDSVIDVIDFSTTMVESLDLACFIDKNRLAKQGHLSQAKLDLSKILITDETIRFNNPRSNPVPRNIRVTKDLCRLMGYYVAEGSRGHHNISFAFHKNETIYHDDVIALINNIFWLNPHLNFSKNSNAVSITQSSFVLYDFFGQFGSKAPNKKIPDWIMHLPVEYQMEFFKGAWRGDGCTSKLKPNSNGFIYTTSSKTLYLQLKMILNRAGIFAGVTVGRANGDETTFAGRGEKLYKIRPVYNLQINGPNASLLAEYLGEPEPREGVIQNRFYARAINGHFEKRIKAITISEYSGLVYNFEVEDDHSYQTESMVCHNCDTTSMALAYLKDNTDERLRAGNFSIMPVGKGRGSNAW